MKLFQEIQLINEIVPGDAINRANKHSTVVQTNEIVPRDELQKHKVVALNTPNCYLTYVHYCSMLFFKKDVFIYINKTFRSILEIKQVKY